MNNLLVCKRRGECENSRHKLGRATNVLYAQHNVWLCFMNIRISSLLNSSAFYLRANLHVSDFTNTVSSLLVNGCFAIMTIAIYLSVRADIITWALKNRIQWNLNENIRNFIEEY